MRCPNCGNEDATSRAFCTKCGHNVTGPLPEAVAPPSSPNNNRRNAILIAGSSALLIFAVVFALTRSDPAPSSLATSPIPDETQDPTDEPVLASTPSQPQVPVVAQSFRTPSGNIGCYVDAELARCDIVERSWEPPPPPQVCELDWGGALSVDVDGTVGFVCAGDTTNDPASPELAYGDTIRVGAFRCDSAETGVTCAHETFGHGFTMSRSRYVMF